MRVFSHTTMAERLALFDLARALPRGARVLEIGSHFGSSALFLGAALNQREGSLLCVDTWANETMPDGEQDTFARFSANTAPFAHLITPIRKRSDRLTPDDIGGPLDMVFIDGDHSEEAVRHDLALTAPFVKQDGVVAFHDLRGGVYPGVGVVIGEAIASREWHLERLIDALAIIRRVSPHQIRDHPC